MRVLQDKGQKKSSAKAVKRKRKPTLFVSGPYTCRTSDRKRRHMEAARVAGRMLAKMGYVVIVPHWNFQHMVGMCYETVLENCIEVMLRCDGVYLLDDWRESPGAVREYAKALKAKMPMYSKLNPPPVVPVRRRK